MSRVIADMSMSLDGFVAREDDGIDELLGWLLGDGDVTVPSGIPGLDWHVPEGSADVMRSAQAGVGALVGGRRYFDLAGGWGGTHPMGVPVFVVTHEAPDGWSTSDSSIHFVTDGVARAVELAKAAAGGKDVGIASPSIVQQCLEAGLLDAVNVNLVPVVLGRGKRYFGDLATPVKLETPTIVKSEGVTHLTYRVVRSGAAAVASHA